MNRTLLAIESSTDWLSVALLEGEAVVLLREHAGSRQHASALLPMIDDVLETSGRRLADLDAIGVSTGPGSFTSLRIGLATVKGLAFGRQIGAVGVSTLEAMALAHLETDPGRSGSSVLSLLDARRGEWYAGRFAQPDGAGGLATAILPEGLYSPARLAADLTDEVVAICPESADSKSLFEAAGLRFAEFVSGPAARPRADWVGRLAQRQLDREPAADARTLSARYLRRAEAEAKRLGGPVEAGEVARLDPRPRGARP